MASEKPIGLASPSRSRRREVGEADWGSPIRAMVLQ